MTADLLMDKRDKVLGLNIILGELGKIILLSAIIYIPEECSLFCIWFLLLFGGNSVEGTAPRNAVISKNLTRTGCTKASARKEKKNSKQASKKKN